MECWARKTPLQTCLLSIILVTLPYLIGILYVYYLIIVVNPEKCKEECFHAPVKSGEEFDSNETEEPNSTEATTRSINYSNTELFDISSEDYTTSSIFRKRDICYFPSNSVSYPFLVAVFQLFFKDDFDMRMFLCSGVVISPHFVLTATDCIINAVLLEKINQVYVRSSSDYWSKDGIVYEIDYVVFGNKTRKFIVTNEYDLSKVAALHVSPRMPFGTEVVSAVKTPKIAVKESEAYSYRWWNSMAHIKEKKYTKAEKSFEKISSHCPGDQNILCCFGHKSCKETKGGPLLSQDESLLGIQIGSICINNHSVFLYQEVFTLRKWIEDLRKIT